MPAVVRAQPGDRGPSPVVVAPVVEADIRTGQEFVGTIVPLQRAVIGSAVDGRVDEYDINEGDRVEAGSALARLKTETIELELATARAELKLRQAEAEELQEEREEVKRQADAEMRAAEAAVKYAKRSLDRIKRLSEQGNAATQEELDEALALFDNAVAVLDQKTAARDLAFAGPRQEKRDQAAARVEMQQHVVEKLEDQLKKHTMITRFTGYVVKELTEVGEWVNRGDPVAEVVALDQVDVLTHVLESHVPHIDIGTRVRLEVPALPPEDVRALEREDGEGLTGRVAVVLAEGDPRSRTFPVKIRVENKIRDIMNEAGEVIGKGQPILKAGMLARVKLPTGALGPRLLVMKDSLVLDGGNYGVYVLRDVNSEGVGTVERVPVQLGVYVDVLAEVQGKIQAGERVVVQGNERLRPGQKVRIVREVRSEELESDSPGPLPRAAAE